MGAPGQGGVEGEGDQDGDQGEGEEEDPGVGGLLVLDAVVDGGHPEIIAHGLGEPINAVLNNIRGALDGEAQANIETSERAAHTAEEDSVIVHPVSQDTFIIVPQPHHRVA